MTDRVGFKVEGLSQTVRDLKAFGLEVDDLKDAFQAISQEAARRAAGHARKKSGRLAASVRGNRAQSKAVVTAGRASVPYAAVQNYGWPKRGISADGFMQKADEEMRPRALALLEAEIETAARKRGLT